MLRDDGDLQPLRQSHAGARVNDVRVTPAADFDKLLRIAGSGDGGVTQQHGAHDWSAGLRPGAQISM